MSRLRIFSFIKRTLALENSPIPRLHIYGLLLFAITAIIAAPFIPVHDDEIDDADITIEQGDEYDEDLSDFTQNLQFSDFGEDQDGILSNTIDLEGLEDTTSEYEWLTYTVKQNETLGAIFRTLNISQGTLQKILKVDVKNSLVQLRINQQIDFLIDENGVLRCLAMPLKNGEQEVLFVRDDVNNRYVSYVDPLDHHLAEAASVVMIPRDQYRPNKIIEGDTQIEIVAGAQNNPATHEIFQNGISDIFSQANASAEHTLAREKAEELAKKKEQEKLALARKKQEEARKRELMAKEKAEHERQIQIAKKKEQERQRQIVGNKTIITGKIVQGSFVRDGEAAGLSHQQMRNISDIYKGKIDFRRDIKKGDTFKVLFDRPVSDGHARILAVSMSTKGKTFNRFLNVADGRYYDEYGPSTTASSKFLMVPIHKFSRISSPFNPSRYHPTLKRYRAHLGTDYACPTGTQVFSTADGVVAKVGHQFPGAGHYVVIDHGNRIQTIYMHLSKILVSKDQVMKKGQVLGLSGMSGGISTGPHVHYQLEINGHAVDSTNQGLPIYNSVRRSNNDMKQFASQVHQYKKKLNLK